jgi:hypothetical protein
MVYYPTMVTKPTPRRRKASKAVPGLAKRLVQAREESSLTRQQAVKHLDWSLTALRSYEAGVTCPTLWDLLQLAQLYSVDPAELAFGTPPAKPVPTNGEIRWVQEIEGGSVPIAGRLLEGLPGPLAAAYTVAPTRGLTLFRSGTMPSAEGGWAAVDTGWGVEVMWIWRSKQRWSAARHGTLKTVPLERQQVLGEISLLCSHADGARPTA